MKKKPDVAMTVTILLFVVIVGFALFRPATPRSSPHQELVRTIQGVGAQVTDLSKQVLEGKLEVAKLTSEGTKMLTSLQGVQSGIKGLDKKMEGIAEVRNELGRLRATIKSSNRDFVREITALRKEVRTAKEEAHKAKELALQEGTKIAEQMDKEVGSMEQEVGSASEPVTN